MTRALACLSFALLFTAAPGVAAPETATPPPPSPDWIRNLPRDPEAATRAYLDRVSPAQKARSDAYFEGGYVLQLVDVAVAVAVSLLLLGTGLSRRIRDWAERRSRRKPIQTFLYWCGYSVLVGAITFPLAVYEGFVREHAYGLSNQTFAAWMGDQLKAFALSIFLGGLAVVVLYGVVRRLPRTWWAWGAAVSILFVIIGGLIAPVFIAPLFNTYTPLTDARVRDPILRLARANGIATRNVYVVDASRQSKRISANVSGLLGTERISLNDNLLHRSSLEEIEAVMGHEMGHYVMNHIWKFIVEIALLALAVFALLQRVLEWALRRWGARWGIRALGDPASLPLVALVFSVLGLLLTPVTNSLIRIQESEADLFGLNAARQPDGFAEAALKLGEYRKLAPGSIEEFVFFDHPSGRTRIFTSMRWKAEQVP